MRAVTLILRGASNVVTVPRSASPVGDSNP
jgi:hypothetical protein